MGADKGEISVTSGCLQESVRVCGPFAEDLRGPVRAVGHLH